MPPPHGQLPADSAHRSGRTPLTALEILAATDLHGSISSAARALGLSQPTASTGLKRLERHLGLVLVTRSPRGAELTDVGRTVATWAREVLESSDVFERGVTALRHAPSSRVRLVASLTIAEYLAPRWLSHPTLTQAETDVELLVRNSQQVMDLVLGKEADLGFVEGAHLRPGLRSRTLVSDSLTVLVAPEHPWARRRRKHASVAELLTAHLIVREEGSGTRETLENALKKVGQQLPAHLAHFGSTASLKLALQSSDSVTALSRLAVADDVARGTLVEIDVPGLDLSRRLRMVWRAEADMPAAVRAIAGFIAAEFPRNATDDDD